MHLPNSCRESWRFCSSPRGAHLSFCLFVEPLSEFLHTWRLLKKRLRNWADEGISSGAFFARETLSTKYRVFFSMFLSFLRFKLRQGIACSAMLSKSFKWNKTREKFGPLFPLRDFTYVGFAGTKKKLPVHKFHPALELVRTWIGTFVQLSSQNHTWGSNWMTRHFRHALR